MSIAVHTIDQKDNFNINAIEHLICQCSVTDLSYIMYNDLQR
jgi:hypothetical protein